MTILDARASRPIDGGPSFSMRNRLTRLAWTIAWRLLAAWTPRQLNGWRCLIARLFGATVAPGATIYGSARIWLPAHLSIARGASIGPGVAVYNMAPIAIGEGTIISQGAHLCAGTHDHRDPAFQLYARPISIGARVWIAAEAFIGPGVAVGEGAVLGARACTFKDLDAWTVYVGNPAQAISERVIRQDFARA